MRFSIFPERTPGDRRAEIVEALWLVAIFIILAAAGLGWSFYAIGHPPPEGSWLDTLGKIALVIGFISLFGILQGLFQLFVAATLGTERLIGLLFAVFLLGLLFTAFGWI